MDQNKKLSDEHLEDKKEGSFVTWLPRLTSDPVQGNGFGLQGEITDNGKKSDPLFKFTPFRHKVSFEVHHTTKNQTNLEISYDGPYLFDTEWRIHISAAYHDNPNGLYFGIGEASLEGLTYRDKNQSQGALIKNARFDERQKNLNYTRTGNTGEAPLVADYFYNYYQIKSRVLNLGLEHYFYDGKIRLVGGLETLVYEVTTYDGKNVQATDNLTGGTVNAQNGKTKLSEDLQSGAITGGGKGFIQFAQSGIIYDTRDFEPEPTKGVFIELAHEQSIKAIGSDFNFGKTVFEARYFKQLLPNHFNRLVLATRASLSNNIGNVPFFEYSDLWSIEGEKEGLGGMRTLRGYKEQRFTAKTIGFANAELRYRFASAKLWNQNFAFNIVPFFDTGRVWNSLSRINTSDLKYAEGLGLRIAWNQSTIIMMDYAQSIEDKQFFLNMNHIF